MIEVTSSNALIGSGCVVNITWWKTAFEHAVDTTIMMSRSIAPRFKPFCSQSMSGMQSADVTFQDQVSALKGCGGDATHGKAWHKELGD